MMERGIRGLPGALVEKPRKGIYQSYQTQDRPHMNEVHPGILLQYKPRDERTETAYIVTGF
jgi:hypothetical protein